LCPRANGIASLFLLHPVVALLPTFRKKIYNIIPKLKKALQALSTSFEKNKTLDKGILVYRTYSCHCQDIFKLKN
jgi:hypothetical protein